jgi:hypothetical protein
VQLKLTLLLGGATVPRLVVFACVAWAWVLGEANAQPATGAAVVPPGYVLDTSGVILHAQVLAVAVSTDHKAGPETEFLIRPSNEGAQSEWFHVRNADVTGAMERGEISGLLMGVAEASIWGGEPHEVNIRYETVNGEKRITAAAIGTGLVAPKDVP